MRYLYYLKGVEEDGSALSNDDIEEKFTKLFHDDMNELLSGTAPYRYIPESYKKVFDLSWEIFDEAKNAYFNGEVSVQEAEQKLEEIESHEYKYRDKSELICGYEAELSECILDVDTIKGERFIQSFRLGEYIDYMNEEDAISGVQEAPEFNNTYISDVEDNLFDDLLYAADEISGVQEAPDFSNTNIFKVPDKLF